MHTSRTVAGRPDVRVPPPTAPGPLAGLTAPVAVAEIELSHPFGPQLRAVRPHDTTLVLVRLHSRPLGTVRFSDRRGDAATRLAEVVWTELGGAIVDHLHLDGVGGPIALGPDGLGTLASPPCLEHRVELLADAPMISVVIATRDRVASLHATLTAVLASDYPSFEVVVVDNSPADDGTHRLIASSFAADDRVRYVLEPTPGLAVAHNTGAGAAVGDIVAFTDDDVIVDASWLAALAEPFRTLPNVGAVSGLIVPLELETAAQILLERHGGFAKGFERRVFDLGDNRPDDVMFPFTIGQVGSGANMAFDAGLLDRLGGFDPALGTGTRARGGDDLAGLLSVIACGAAVVYEPAAIVRHRHRRRGSDLASQATGYGVGLGAYLASALLEHPSLLLRAVRGLPAAARLAFAPSSDRNAHRYDGWPDDLAKRERRGMLLGPFAYAMSRFTMPRRPRRGRSQRRGRRR